MNLPELGDAIHTLRWTDDGPEVVVIGSMLEDSPEGLFRADRLRRANDERWAEMSPQEQVIHAEFERRLEHAVLYGDDPGAA